MNYLNTSNVYGAEVALGGNFLKRLKPQLFFRVPKLIGLHGKARCGKDTVGQMLVDLYRVRTTAYADPVRAAVAAALGMSLEEYLKLDKAEVIEWIGKTRRQLEQTLGTAWGREQVKHDFWELQVERKIEEFQENGYDVVVTDVRFDSEAEQIRSLGGTIWHIYRPGQPIAESNHISEAGVEFKEGDLRIDNDGSLEDLFEVVVEAFEQGE